MAQRTWRRRWAERRVLLFVDNDSARHALIRGGSLSFASACLVGLFWEEETRMRAFAWVERVPSSSNPADGPSRLNFELMRRMGAVRTEPLLIQAHRLTGRLV